MSSQPPIAVVGIGADGWPGLGEAAREAVASAETLIGSARQLALVPETGATRLCWPSPIDPLVDQLAAGIDGSVCVLASGDPMLHGIGATLARRIGVEALAVHPYVSACALACARLGWPAAEVELVSAVGQPVEVLTSSLASKRRVIVYVSGPSGAAKVAAVLCAHGYCESRLVVLEQLGGHLERIIESTATQWGVREADSLHLVAIECRADADALVVGRTPGLPDEAFETDGQLTKWIARAATLAALRPTPHALLWDVGAGSGSVGIEWLRAEPTASAIAIESRADRVSRIAANALRLGVPRLAVHQGVAPEALGSLDAPDAVFVGGGVSNDGLLIACWQALRRGGKIVANAVTLEGEQALQEARRAWGGTLVRLTVSHPEPVGRFEAWHSQLPVVQWAAVKAAA